VGLSLYSLIGIVAETEIVTHALTLFFGIASVLAGWLSLTNRKASHICLWIVSVMILFYSVAALSMVGLEFGFGFVSGIVLLAVFAAMTIFCLLRKRI